LQSFDEVTRELERILDNPALETMAPATRPPDQPVSPRGPQGTARIPAGPPPAPGDLPPIFDKLPPQFRTQTWLMIFAAGAVLGALFVLYLVLSVLKIV
jgi:hypothetical protein